MRPTETTGAGRSGERPPPPAPTLGSRLSTALASMRASQGGSSGPRASAAERGSRWRRIGVADVLVAGLIALVLYLAFEGGVAGRDGWHTLLWGTELASGRLPDYQAPFAPTPHPLLILYAAVLSPLGQSALPVLLATAMVALGAIAVGLFRLGERLYAWPVGLLAAAIVLTRDTFLYYGVRAGVDVMTLALIVWAAVLEAHRPRRGGPVLVVLLFAGLLRPEAWLFAGAYWLWLMPDRGWRARIGLGALTAVAPALWALSDFAVTGDPLWSLHGTRELASELERQTGVSALPARTWGAANRILSQPELLLVGAGGLVGALAFFRRATALPIAILVIDAAAFVALAVFGLPLNARYLLPAGLVVLLFVAVAGLGWTAVSAERRARVAWIAGGIAALAVLAVSLPRQQPAIAALRADVVAREANESDLRALLETSRVRRTLGRCGPLIAPNIRLRPQYAYLTDRRERGVAVGRGRGLPDRGVFVRSVPKPEPSGRGIVRVPPSPYRELARNRSWLAYASC